MSVHLQIAEQVKKHRHAQKEFLALDAARERAIEETLSQAKAGKPIQTTEINRITNEMNQIAMTFQFPPRKNVTVEMIKEYLKK
ncbi:DUF2533 family protein [Halalkalibacter nanhaiisediminis]|uniref:Uncharacterized protein DUF2533 n=1 Tax=Halalkalibacter nanhaiisediminis TaxID=688079 RepID=A0A562QK02_9BACI|nr:DUF2533 family protein [Halalkalibacter nanhaiisediminis]TWI56376.1 uncharacterized protein DUF2533 [Halalkalibacter nanhaiisediminis]